MARLLDPYLQDIFHDQALLIYPIVGSEDLCEILAHPPRPLPLAAAIWESSPTWMDVIDVLWKIREDQLAESLYVKCKTHYICKLV